MSTLPSTKKGKEEDKIKVARNLLKAGVSIEVIAKSIDITVDWKLNGYKYLFYSHSFEWIWF